jgi:hypothetical protein
MLFKMKKSTRLLAAVATLLIVGCGDVEGGNEVDGISQKALVSDCGGFLVKRSALKVPSALNADDYCDAEVLKWQYDSAAGTLTITNDRVLLNCCGEHGIKIEQQADGTYLITETDDPEKLDDGSTSRCLCSCVYDFKIEAQAIPNESISVRVVRDIAEESALIEVWEGSLNLPEEPTGSITVNEDDASIWCDETN